jgi:putative spermidine/putrescine transport system substrate-binding protein
VQTLNSLNYMCVLKGTPRKAAAMKFMAMLVRPDRQAAFADILGYTPTVRKAAPLISAGTKKWMPDMTSPGTVVMDDKWWQSNYAPLQKRFSEWLLV